MSELVRTLGYENVKKFNDNFDEMLMVYRQKAKNMGYSGELKFKKESGKIVIFVEIK